MYKHTYIDGMNQFCGTLIPQGYAKPNDRPRFCFILIIT